jgi:hypothetical protein
LGGRGAGEADLDLLGGVEADGALEEALGAEGEVRGQGEGEVVAGLADEVGRAGGDAVGWVGVGLAGVGWVGVGLRGIRWATVRLATVRLVRVRLVRVRLVRVRLSGVRLVRVRLAGGRLGRVRLGNVPRSGKTNRMRGHGVFAGKGVGGRRGCAAEIAGMPEV